MKLPVPFGGKSVMCRVEGGPADGREVLIPFGVKTLSFPMMTDQGLIMVSYAVCYHDDRVVAR